MSRFVNFLVGLSALALYPAIGGVLAALHPDGRSWDWGIFAVGPILFLLFLVALIFLCLCVENLGRALRKKISRRRARWS